MGGVSLEGGSLVRIEAVVKVKDEVRPESRRESAEANRVRVRRRSVEGELGVVGSWGEGLGPAMIKASDATAEVTGEMEEESADEGFSDARDSVASRRCENKLTKC